MYGKDPFLVLMTVLIIAATLFAMLVVGNWWIL